MKPETVMVMMGDTVEEMEANADLYGRTAEKIEKDQEHVRCHDAAERLCGRFLRAMELYREKLEDPENYDPAKESELDMYKTPLCEDEDEAAFANKHFYVDEILYLQLKLFDEVNPRLRNSTDGSLIRLGLIAELQKDYTAARKYYDTVKEKNEDLLAHIARLEQKVYDSTHCCAHKDAPAVAYCVSCGRPICSYCVSNYQTYSVAAESGVPYCPSCYDRALGYYKRHH